MTKKHLRIKQPVNQSQAVFLHLKHLLILYLGDA